MINFTNCMQGKQLANTLLITGLILLALIYGKQLLMPFIAAMVIWYVLNSVRKLIGGIKIGGRTLPWYLQLSVAAGLFLTFVLFVSRLVKSNFEEFVEVYPKYHKKILSMSREVTDYLNLPVSIDEIINELDIPTLMSNLLNSSMNIISGISLVIIYVIFIMAEERVFKKKIQAIFSTKEKLKSFSSTVSEIDASIRSYITTKTVICLCQGIAGYIVLEIIGVDFAVLWAIVIFLTNYIPIVGALISPLFPTVFALIQFDTFSIPILVLSLLTTIQVITGNFIEPKVLGDRLNLSPLVVILALSFWGTIWGIGGMILCVPITVILMIIFSHFPRTKGIAILLSGGKGLG